MKTFRFLRANRQAQYDWIQQNRGTYLAFNAVLAVAILGPTFYESWRSERAQRKFYEQKLNEQ